MSSQEQSQATNKFHASVPTSELMEQKGYPSAQPAASDTLSGTTSKDVNRGVGKPVQGMSSRERHSVTKKEQQGVAWTGTVPVDLNAAESKKEAQDFKREFEGKQD
ncbi:uncharacterized protein DFL_003271 [Arthrobotrys flagrans]|uniref:Uncharacterized protein n=1 Tax=Arthrobotrys flagrans TaxID=97331 RepID=A0A437A1C7_ARTFL|nr:hypothetical protein DFL_003271 [Arthrobotrys flagrans]